MLSLNFYHAVFHLTSILIPPLQKLSLAKSHTHPNYSPYSAYTGAQPIRKLITNKSSVPSALSPINRAFVLSLDLRNRFVPYGPKKTGKDVPWIRSRHRRARQAKQVAFFLFKSNPSHATLSFTRPNPEDCRSCCGFQEDNMSRSLLMR